MPGVCVGILVDAVEPVADRHGGDHRGWIAAVSRGKHIFHRNRREALHIDVAGHAVGRIFAVIVHALQGVEDRGHHRHRRELEIVEHFEMKLFRLLIHRVPSP